MTGETTKSYTQEHIDNVRLLLGIFSDVLREKGENHDKSKLEEPEIYGWMAMDREPRYKYGTKEYYEKMRKYAAIFDHHYAVNTHHPEHFKSPENEMTLIDAIEMLCDWFAYKRDVDKEDALYLIRSQCIRFGFSESFKNLLSNTYLEYLDKNDAEYQYNQNKLIADLKLSRTNKYYEWKRFTEKVPDLDELPSNWEK